METTLFLEIKVHTLFEITTSSAIECHTRGPNAFCYTPLPLKIFLRTIHTGIPILQPSPSNILILFIDDMFHVFTKLLNVIGIHNSRDACSDRQYSYLASIRSMENNVCVPRMAFCLVNCSQRHNIRKEGSFSKYGCLGGQPERG